MVPSIDGGFCLGAHIQLAEYRGTMRIDGLWTNEEAIGDLPVTQTERNQSKHV
jgi:hypothetical protein